MNAEDKLTLANELLQKVGFSGVTPDALDKVLEAFNAVEAANQPAEPVVEQPTE